MRFSFTPTRLLPAPTPASSLRSTVCLRPAGSAGITVSANRVFRVLAGGSLRCALYAASTSPVRASATSHDTAETSRGTLGAPALARTCVPDRYSGGGSCEALASCGPGSIEGRTPSGLDVMASTPITHTAEQPTTVRETRGARFARAAREARDARELRESRESRESRDENPMVIPQT